MPTGDPGTQPASSFSEKWSIDMKTAVIVLIALSYNSMRKQGVGTVYVGARRPRRPHCATKEAGGLVRPFPREWGATMGRPALACPLSTRTVRHGQGEEGRRHRAPRARPFHMNGKGWAGVACPCAPLSLAYRAARSKGCQGSRAPRARPFRANGKGGTGGSSALAHPFPARTGRCGREAACPLVACPRASGIPSMQMGRGQGWRALTYTAAQPKGKGQAPGNGERRRWRALKGRGREEKVVAGCPRAHPFGANGEMGKRGGTYPRRNGRGPEEMGRRSGGQCGVGEEEGDSPLCTPCLRSSGAAVNARERRGGNLPCLRANRATRDVGDGRRPSSFANGEGNGAGGGGEISGTQSLPPPSLLPHLHPIRVEGGAQGHVAPSPSPSPLPCTRRMGDAAPGPSLSHSHGRGAHEGTPLRAPTLPIPSSCHPIRVKRGHANPRPLPSPLRVEGGRTSPFPFAQKGSRMHEGTPPRTHGKGHEGHPVATGPSLSPFDHAALYAQERGTRGGTPPPDHAALYARERDAQGQATPRSHPFHSRGKGAHEGHVTPGILSTAPPCTRGKGARKGTQPWPNPSHSRGRGAHEGHDDDAPLLLGHAAPYARTGGTRGQAAPSWRPIRAGRGARGHPPPSWRSGVSAVSVRPRTPRPHPVFACYCTT
ncbi:hypothetical protein EDB83DRAFT_2617785 [Lactarius deliciosus]|nr:hypothetical protein EDB83DRAFT_2617785 [Lactarius deliciosus]